MSQRRSGGDRTPFSELADMQRDVYSLVSSLVEKGTFGDVRYVDIKLDDQTVKGAQFVSSLQFIDLLVEGGSVRNNIPLVVKILAVKDWSHGNCKQFQTEFTMYNEILPALGAEQSGYPKMFYGKVTGRPGEDILILENMRHKDFFNSKQKLLLDFDHISLAMKTIAKFHSLSYILKHNNNKKFQELSKMVRPDEYVYGSIGSIESAVSAFQKTKIFTKEEAEVLKKFLDVVNNEPIISKTSSAEEPFSVICHGDFCNNNVLYKYSNERPIDCVMFDFQLSRHGSPVTDLAFFLYMHSTSETRHKFWDDFLKIYWETLRENVPKNITLPSYQTFLKHFASRAVYGFWICSFFISIMLNENREEKIQQEDKEAEEIVTDVIAHLLQKKYIHAFLDFVKH